MTEQPNSKYRVNWRQAIGEGFVLLVGVLLALGGQAWWEARAEQRVVDGYVANLLTELNSNHAGLERTIVLNNEVIGDATGLLELMEANDRPIAPGAMLGLISKLTLFNDFRPATAALDNLLGAGGMGLFENAELQAAISKYGQAIDDHNVLQVELANFQINRFMVFLERSVPLVRTEYAKRIPEPRPAGQFEFEASELASSLQFENLLVIRARSEGDAANFAERLIKSIEQLRELLEPMASVAD